MIDFVYYYVSIKLRDRSKILSYLFDAILHVKGDVIHFRQDLQDSGVQDSGVQDSGVQDSGVQDSGVVIRNAIIHLIVKLKNSDESENARKYLQDSIKERLDGLYDDLSASEKEKFLIKVKKREAASVNKVIGKFEIFFFDKIGVARDIFSIFSTNGISVLESKFLRLPAVGGAIEEGLKKRVGRITLLSDFSGDKKESSKNYILFETIKRELSELNEVFLIDANLNPGIFSI